MFKTIDTTIKINLAKRIVGEAENYRTKAYQMQKSEPQNSEKTFHDALISYDQAESHIKELPIDQEIIDCMKEVYEGRAFCFGCLNQNDKVIEQQDLRTLISPSFSSFNSLYSSLYSKWSEEVEKLDEKQMLKLFERAENSLICQKQYLESEELNVKDKDLHLGRITNAMSLLMTPLVKNQTKMIKKKYAILKQNQSNNISLVSLESEWNLIINTLNEYLPWLERYNNCVDYKYRDYEKIQGIKDFIQSAIKEKTDMLVEFSPTNYSPHNASRLFF